MHTDRKSKFSGATSSLVVCEIRAYSLKEAILTVSSKIEASLCMHDAWVSRDEF